MGGRDLTPSQHATGSPRRRGKEKGGKEGGRVGGWEGERVGEWEGGWVVEEGSNLSSAVNDKHRRMEGQTYTDGTTVKMSLRLIHVGALSVSSRERTPLAGFSATRSNWVCSLFSNWATRTLGDSQATRARYTSCNKNHYTHTTVTQTITHTHTISSSDSTAPIHHTHICTHHAIIPNRAQRWQQTTSHRRAPTIRRGPPTIAQKL
jgi:hypothetical protein